MAINIYIGTEDDQLIPQQVLEYSIRKNSKSEVNIRPVKQDAQRVGGTNFGFVRFQVPNLNNYEGKAIYLDADQLVFADIQELEDGLDHEHAIALVNHPKGTFGGKEVGPSNQTSVMVLDCEKLLDWVPETMFSGVVPNRSELQEGQIHYRDFMMLSWFDQELIQPLDPRWNHFNILESDTKLTHFSHVRSQPWKNPSHPLTEVWGRWLKEAVKAGAVKRSKLLLEVGRGAIDKHFLAYIF